MEKEISESIAPTEHCERKWFIAVVKNHGELRSKEFLQRDMADVEGFEVYVPTVQKEVRRPNGTKKNIESVLLSAKVLVRCTEQERLKRVVTLPYILRFYMSTNRYSESGRRMLAVIPDKQLEAFRRAVESSDQVTFDEGLSIRRGINVRVVSGPLQGLTGVTTSLLDNKNRLYVQLGDLGFASVEIDAASLEVVS